ncbi:LytTR family DNA-binding domain-containing protein [Maribacter sp.]|uniref:LytR/AlgR family response regulator transcription factor n=1 Tax=Maribacter sp. TaxID=1897614 RepID=UPI0025C08DD5|nr:LytTR family DNA-binding domain-containing protein [Maribacter sp.]
MKAIIIDDEPKARNLLKVLLEENCLEIKQIFTASNLLDGVELIQREMPQLVFLDIEMPEHSGLEILDFIDKDKINFEIIFTTAYGEYALKAFELAAVDYLLKPLRAAQLKKAVEKCIALVGKSQLNLRLKELKESLSLDEFKKIGLPVADGIKFVELKNIIVFEADGMYTSITTIDKSKILISKPIKYFADLLINIPCFYKPHRSFMINLRFIKQYVKSDGGYIILDNDKTVSISKEKREEFLKIVSSI